MVKKAKTKRIKKDSFQSEDQNEIRRFIIIIAIIIVVILAVYFFTRIFVSKDLLHKEEKNPAVGTINYDMTLIGSMLNKVEDEYFVLIYNSKDNDYVYYMGIVNNYTSDEEAKRVYIADISNELNKNYISDEENLKTDNVEEFRVSKPTLLMVKKGKITDTYTTKEEMAKALKVEKES